MTFWAIPLSTLFSGRTLVGAVGIGLHILVENTQLIDFSTRSKRCRIRERAQLARVWNTTPTVIRQKGEE
jgi:hypothetical protein